MWKCLMGRLARILRHEDMPLLTATAVFLLFFVFLFAYYGVRTPRNVFDECMSAAQGAGLLGERRSEVALICLRGAYG